MTYERIFDESYERVVKAESGGKTFFAAFYERFLGSSGQVAEKFRHTDMVRQQAMLEKSFYYLLTFYATNHADHRLQKIALKHGQAELDIEPTLYDLWLEQLMETVAEFDPQFSDIVELSWRLVLAPGIAYMKFFYDREPLPPL